jgi:hypothetical protein
MRALRIISLVLCSFVALALFQGISITAAAPIIPELAMFALMCAGIGMLAMWHPKR